MLNLEANWDGRAGCAFIISSYVHSPNFHSWLFKLTPNSQPRRPMPLPRQYHGKPPSGTLMPLAINIISQPLVVCCPFIAGIARTCAAHRFFALSTPLISCYESPACQTWLRVSFRSAFDIVVRERYKDSNVDDYNEEGTEEVGEGVQSLEMQTWLRWVSLS